MHYQRREVSRVVVIPPRTGPRRRGSGHRRTDARTPRPGVRRGVLGQLRYGDAV